MRGTFHITISWYMATNESIYALADQDEYKEDIAYGKINY